MYKGYWQAKRRQGKRVEWKNSLASSIVKNAWEGHFLVFGIEFS